MDIRTLRADEIECRVNQIRKTERGDWCTLLLYKDARCDMRILDEVYGPLNWNRQHELIGDRLYCTVSVYNSDTHEWVSKQDVGTESYTEKEKGQASDSFKRACTNWGIGRELYSAPNIKINLFSKEVTEKNGKISLAFGVRFHVAEIEYNDKREISKLVIGDNDNNPRYVYEPEVDEVIDEIERESLMKVYHSLGGQVTRDFVRIVGIHPKDLPKMTKREWGEIMQRLNKQMDDEANKKALENDA